MNPPEWIQTICLYFFCVILSSVSYFLFNFFPCDNENVCGGFPGNLPLFGPLRVWWRWTGS